MIYFKERPNKLKVKAVKIILGILIIISITFINFNFLNDNSIFAFAIQNYIQYDNDNRAGNNSDIETKDAGNGEAGDAADLNESKGESAEDESASADEITDNNLSDEPVESDDTGVTNKPVEPERPAVPEASVKPNNPPQMQNAQQYVPSIVSNPSDVLALINKKNRLPTDYIPKNLVVPNVPFTFKEYSERRMMRQDAALALEKMFMKASEYNINLYGISGYRSYSYQQSIFASNVSKYGFESANQFSAKPGESEHQTGLAMDITSASVGFGLTQSFGETKEGKWVKDNAHKFGFIIRYQRGKEYITGYQYEPWHLRYVGPEAAAEIVNRNITLEEYLANK